MSRSHTQPRLILIRHAHRDTSDPSADNGLSKKGWKQAERLAQWGAQWQKENQDFPIEYFTSPRVRCCETLRPWMEQSDKNVTVDNRLTEQSWDEGQRKWQSRIQDFLDDWKKSGKTWVICSHGDWIPTALLLLGIQNSACEKGSWTEISGAPAQLIRYLSRPDS